MKKVTINSGCISCGSCAFTVPEVFEVTDISHVKEVVRKYPVQVITFEE